MLIFMLVTGPSPAYGITLVNSDGSPAQPYQTWADQSRMPTPVEFVTIHYDHVYEYCGRWACTFQSDTGIWLDPTVTTRFDFLHEVGHRVDFQSTDRIRNAFRRLVRDGRDWNAGPIPLREQFAHAYAFCALGGTSEVLIRQRSLTAMSRRANRRQRNVCRLLHDWALA